jgi:glyoxylase I family protein
MLNIVTIHHIAIICSDYETSKDFYTRVLGLKMLKEHFRQERHSWKADLALGDRYVIELFSFPDPPLRPSHPEACGLRHLAFEVENIDDAIAWLSRQQVQTEPVRTDEYTGKKFTFFTDPDKLPLELYQK